MAKKFKLSNEQAFSLFTVFKTTNPQETLKAAGSDDLHSLKHIIKVEDELEEATKDYVELIKEIDKDKLEVRKQFQKELDDILSSSDDDGIKQFKENKLNQRAKPILEKEDKKIHDKFKFDEERKRELEIVIGGDDRFDLLKSVYKSVAAQRFTDKRVLVSILEAIESAEDV